MSTVLITGTSKGIGFTAALAFARAGHKVAAAMRNPERAPELSKVAAKEKLPITVYTIDVNADESVINGVAQIIKQEGPIDVLVNNAGIEAMGSVAENSLKVFRDVMETNYFGVIRCTQAVLPGMMKRKSGHIINISSVAGRIASPAMSAYSASKYALESFSEILAQEVKASGVRVAIVEPGIIDTDMSRHITVMPDKTASSYQARLAGLFTASLKRPVSPTLVADKIVEIAVSGTWQLRHPVGPDALPFFGWRASMTDEAWVDLAALSDDDWYKKMEGDFGMDMRLK